MHIDQNFFRVVAVKAPEAVKDLFLVDIVLQNMKGEEQVKKIAFSSSGDAFTFYLTQKKIIEGCKK